MHRSTHTDHAFEVMVLANKYKVGRLEMLCLEALGATLAPHNAIHLLQGACAIQNTWLFTQARQYIAKHGLELQVKQCGGLGELTSLELTKGLVGDAVQRCAELERQQARPAPVNCIETDPSHDRIAELEEQVAQVQTKLDAARAENGDSPLQPSSGAHAEGDSPWQH